MLSKSLDQAIQPNCLPFPPVSFHESDPLTHPSMVHKLVNSSVLKARWQVALTRTRCFNHESLNLSSMLFLREMLILCVVHNSRYWVHTRKDQSVQSQHPNLPAPTPLSMCVHVCVRYVCGVFLVSLKRFSCWKMLHRVSDSDGRWQQLLSRWSSKSSVSWQASNCGMKTFFSSLFWFSFLLCRVQRSPDTLEIC